MERVESCFSSCPSKAGVQSRVGSHPQRPTGQVVPLEGEAVEEDPTIFDDVEEGMEEDLEEACEEHGVAVKEAEEGRMAKPLKAPSLPSPEEIEAHEVSHIPFRAWCSHCVRGRGKSYSHQT